MLYKTRCSKAVTAGFLISSVFILGARYERTTGTLKSISVCGIVGYSLTGELDSSQVAEKNREASIGDSHPCGCVLFQELVHDLPTLDVVLSHSTASPNYSHLGCLRS